MKYILLIPFLFLLGCGNLIQDAITTSFNDGNVIGNDVDTEATYKESQ